MGIRLGIFFVPKGFFVKKIEERLNEIVTYKSFKPTKKFEFQSCRDLNDVTSRLRSFSFLSRFDI